MKLNDCPAMQNGGVPGAALRAVPTVNSPAEHVVELRKPAQVRSWVAEVYVSKDHAAGASSSATATSRPERSHRLPCSYESLMVY